MSEIKSLYKAIDILEELSKLPEGARIQDLSTELNIPGSTIHRILSTLETRGYVIQGSGNRYFLGSKILDLQFNLKEGDDLIKVSRPIIENIVNKTRESCNLAVLEDTEVIHILRIESPQVLRANIQNYRLPVHSSATGKVLLAFSPKKVMDVLPETFESYTPNTITTKEELFLHLNKIRQLGYAMDNEEGFERVRSIAVPIRKNKNEVVSSLSIVGPSERLTLEKIPEYLNILFEATQEISLRISFN